MARAGTYSSLGTTQTAYFRSDWDYKNGQAPTASTGITTGGDGTRTKGFRVTALSTDTTNTIVYINGKLSGYVVPGTTQEFITIDTNRSPSGGRLELKAASGTVNGTFGTLD